jgi:hypothetical protein
MCCTVYVTQMENVHTATIHIISGVTGLVPKITVSALIQGRGDWSARFTL